MIVSTPGGRLPSPRAIARPPAGARSRCLTPSSKTAVTCAKPLRESERVDCRPGDASERVLHRERDLLLDLEGREAGRDGVDLHLVVGDVRDGVDRQFLELEVSRRRRRPP
jgi:hypothetical protein